MTAWSAKPGSRLRRSARDGGMTLSLAPLSTMKRRPLTLSHTKNMRLNAVEPAELVAVTRWRWLFPTSCTGSGSGRHACQKWRGTNRGQGHLSTQGTAIERDPMMGGGRGFCCDCATPSVARAALAEELALSAPVENRRPVLAVVGCSLKSVKLLAEWSMSPSSDQRQQPFESECLSLVVRPAQSG